MNEILKVLNKEIKRLQDEVKDINDLFDNWREKGISLEREVRDLKQEKEVLMQEINDLTNNK